MAGLLQYEPTPIVEQLVELALEDPCGLLVTLAQDDTLRQRVPEQRRTNVTLETLV